MGPTVAIWLTPQSRTPAFDDLDRIVHRLDPGARSIDDFHISDTGFVGGRTRVSEPRPFGLTLGIAGLDDADLRTSESLLGFRPNRIVNVFACANATVDHRILGELVLFLGRELDGPIDFGGTLRVIAAPGGKLIAIPYAWSNLAETFHVGDTVFLEWWLQQSDFHMVK